MIFMRDRCAEQSEDAVASRLGDVAAVAPHRLHHQLECRIDDGARFFVVEVFDRVYRALDVSK
jgi:hypothetical protein